MGDPTSVTLVGTGLIGGSIGLALRRAGVRVLGIEREPARGDAALAAGAVDDLTPDLATAVAATDLTVVAVPVGSVADVVIAALDAGAPLVTDVGSVKAPVVGAIEAARPDAAARFVGGHPMAGSEQEGLAGASADLFVGATWVLTPTSRTDPQAFAAVRSWVTALGAESLAVAPELHDALVAVVSHVPQLAASTLMNVANRGSDEHAVLLRLAAGGFRDMTRIASSHPAIWPDICLANRDAIVDALDAYLDELGRVRSIVADGDRGALLALLDDARAARRNLPVGIPVDDRLVELRVPVPDREGVIAEVTTLAARHGINIVDLEIAHSLEGRAGVLVLVVAERGLDEFEQALIEHGYHVARTPLPVNDELVVVGPRPLRGRLRVPGDKGMSHRALLFAAMADGQSRVRGLAGGEDVGRTRDVLGLVGVAVSADDDAVVVQGHGVESFVEPAHPIDCGNSGTSLRLLAGLLAGRPFRSVLTGDASLVQRPMARVIEPLRAMGAQVDGEADGTRPPLEVRGGDLVGCADRLTVASAQVKTALLLAGLQASGTTEVTEPAPSRDHTERMLRALGAPVMRLDERAVRVTAGAPGSFEFDVPGDPSSAAFWVVAATIVGGSELVIEDVALNPSRIAFVDVLERMGASIEMVTTGERLGEPVGELRVESVALHGTTVEGVEIPWVIDEIPVLAVAAAFADGVTEFRDAGELRVKESDRIATVSELLTRVGVGSEQGSDHLVVRGGRPASAVFESHGDHRVAMAGAVAALALEGETTVRGWGSVATSYPEFTRDLALLTGGGA